MVKSGNQLARGFIHTVALQEIASINANSPVTWGTGGQNRLVKEVFPRVKKSDENIEGDKD